MATSCHLAVKMVPCNRKQISWFRCTALTAIYKPEVYPPRISSWEIVFSSCSIYANVVKPPCDQGAPEERQMRSGNIIRHDRKLLVVCLLHVSGPIIGAWCVLFNWRQCKFMVIFYCCRDSWQTMSKPHTTLIVNMISVPENQRAMAYF